MKLIHVLLTLNLLYQVTLCMLSCKNENNQDVDWFIGLKFPKSYKFVYLSSEFDKWIVPKFNLSNKLNLVGLTIEQTYLSNETHSFYAYYNDEIPNFTYIDRGHLKGIISFDETSGFWLIHSIPLFPTFGNYSYRPGEAIYGQAFFCVSLSTDNLINIVTQLLIMQSSVYNFYLPPEFPVDDKTKSLLNAFVNNKNLTFQKTNNTIIMKTLLNLPLIHFGKSYEFGQDLYSGLVAPTLETSIMVETWIRGEKVNSSCDSEFKVYNVEVVNLDGEKFVEFHDHSKWVISNSENKPFICIGDINRMTSQFKRGGGTLCVNNNNIWKNFQPIVAGYEDCTNSIQDFLPLFSLEDIKSYD